MLSRMIFGRSRFQTIIPAIKKEMASTKRAHPDPNSVTNVPPSKRTKYVTNIGSHAQSQRFHAVISLSVRISGSTPDIAGHQRAFKIPKSAPISAKKKDT
jgi:hypothetical protein